MYCTELNIYPRIKILPNICPNFFDSYGIFSEEHTQIVRETYITINKLLQENLQLPILSITIKLIRGCLDAEKAPV